MSKDIGHCVQLRGGPIINKEEAFGWIVFVWRVKCELLVKDRAHSEQT